MLELVLNLDTNGAASINFEKQSTEDAKFNADGEVELFHNNVKIFRQLVSELQLVFHPFNIMVTLPSPESLH